MRIICSREIFTKKCRQQQSFDYNHVTFTSIAKNFMAYCRLIYMLSMLYVRLTIKLKVRIPESFKEGWYHYRKTGSRPLTDFIDTTVLACVSQGVIKFYGKIGECSPPHLVLPLTVEPSKLRLCHDERFLNLWIRDLPFKLDHLKDLPRYVLPGHF